jgi:hypothetical protein
MLHPDPNQRPRDLVVLAEMIRECLLKIERRRALADKYGIPYRTTIPRQTAARPKRFLRIALPVAALLLAAAVIAAVLLPEPIGRFVHRARETKPIGVVIGVPESSAPSAVQNASTAIAPAAVTSQAGNAAAMPASPPPVNGATSSTSPQVSSPDLQQTQTLNVQSQVAAPNASGASSPGPNLDGSSSSGGETASTGTTAAHPNTASQPSSHGKKNSVASTSRRPRGAQDLSEASPQRHVRSIRGRVVGITSDGRLIYRLPSGRTAIVAPDSEEDQFVPRRRRRVLIERDEETFVPPPRFAPDYFPDD